jgi:hypothetical protein
MSLRFQLDEHVGDAVAHGLRRRGVDVLTAAEAGIRSTPDQTILALAGETQRVVVTHDQDYLRLHAAGEPHYGIAFSAYGSRTIGQLIAALISLDRILSPDDMRNQLKYL